MTCSTLNSEVPQAAMAAIETCPFMDARHIEALRFREAPYWHSLLKCRHLGIHRPDKRICNWTARLLTRDKRYIQKCLGPAIDVGRGRVGFEEAVNRAFEWFDNREIRSLAHEPRPIGRTTDLNVCPIGSVYTVGHALKDYTDWTRIARSPGGHYNNLVLINHHIVPGLAQVPLEQFNARNLADLAQRVIVSPPRRGFSPYRNGLTTEDLPADDLRKRKRTFNSLVSILRMAFRYAWESGHIQSERPWRSLRRVSVVHTPRSLFLTREECGRLLKCCTPALRKLVLAALYTGCRVGELGAIRVEDVAREGYGLHLKAFKRSPARFVFLPDEGMAFFLECCQGKADRDRVLLSDMGKVWRKQHTSLFRRAVSLAGLPKTFVFHGLRHTYASDLVRSGVPLDIVARQLGHSSTRTVSDTYGHLAEHFREDQVRSRFTALSPEFADRADERRDELNQLVENFRKGDWRRYAEVSPADTRPVQAYCSASEEVLEAFQAAERRTGN